MAGVLNTITDIVNERNSSLSNNTPNGANIEYQNMHFPFRIRAGKKDSYDYVRQEIHPTIDKNVWEMTVVFRKIITNARIPVETSVRFEVTNDIYNGIIIKYNGRSYIIPPQYGHGHKREQNFIQIADMKFDIEFLR